MFQLLLLAAVIYILFKWLRQGSSPAQKARNSNPFRESREPGGQKVEEMVQDPVCGMWVPVSQAVVLTLGKETIYFCSNECREKFQQSQKTN